MKYCLEHILGMLLGAFGCNVFDMMTDPRCGPASQPDSLHYDDSTLDKIGAEDI